MFSARCGFTLYQADVFSDLAIGTSSGAPFLQSYRWSDNNGYGSKLTSPSTWTGAATIVDMAFNPANTYIAAVTGTTPFLNMWAYTVGTGFGTKVANPSSLPAGGGRSVSWHPTGSSIALSMSISPYINVYAFSGGVIGSKFSNPAVFPTSTGRRVTFNNAGDNIALGWGNAPYIYVYPWSNSTGFGTRWTSPGTIPPAIVRGLGFSPLDNVLFVGNDNATIQAYNWSNSTGFGSIIGTTTPNSFSNGVDDLRVSALPQTGVLNYMKVTAADYTTSRIGNMIYNASGSVVSNSSTATGSLNGMAVKKFSTAVGWATNSAFTVGRYSQSSNNFPTTYPAPTPPVTGTPATGCWSN